MYVFGYCYCTVQRRAELRDKLQTRYAESQHDGVTIAFRFPDGTKVEHKFYDTDITKVFLVNLNTLISSASIQRLYQYVFSIVFSP